MHNDKSLYIGLDLGTSSVKGVLVNADLELLSTANSKFRYKKAVLKDGSHYIGIDCEEYFSAICDVISTFTKRLNKSQTIAGISMVSASGNTVLVDSLGNALIDAYSWTNPPMDKEVEIVFGKLDSEKVADVCGWQFYNTFPLAHLAHLKCHAPEILRSADYICTTTEYVILRLTGKRVSDFSTATPFYLANQVTGNWHKPYLDKLDISESKLPTLYRTGHFAGTILPSASHQTGLSADTKLFLGSFDHPGAARATGITERGQLLISCGTSWVCFFPHGNRDAIIREKLLCDTFLAPKGYWGAMFSLSQVGIAIDKYIEKYISVNADRFAEFEYLVANSPNGTGGLNIDLTNPDMEIDTNKHTRYNIAAAIAEAPAYMLKRQIDKLRQSGICFESAAVAGAPSESAAFINALEKITGLTFKKAYGAYGGAVGAAMYASDNSKNLNINATF